MLIKAARQRIALAEHTKFGRQSFAFVAPVTDIDILVTDNGVEQKYVDQLREMGVQVIIAEVKSEEASKVMSEIPLGKG